MDDKVFTFVDLTEGDHEFSSMKYVGEDISNKICICSVSNSSSSLLSAITEEINPIGFFIINISDIINPIDFANGSEPCLKFVRSFRNEVFKIGEITLIIFEKPNLCAKQSVDTIFEMVKPQEILVLDSIPKSSFVGETDFPTTYILPNQIFKRETENIEYPILPAVNKVSGVGAGLLIRGEIENVKARFVQVVEDDKGPSINSLTLLAKEVSKYIQIDINAKTKLAYIISKNRLTNSHGIYS